MRAHRNFGFGIATLPVLAVYGSMLAQNRSTSSNDGPATQGVGLIRNESGAYAGYTLISPLQSTSTFLIDMSGRVVKTWETDSTPASIAYLLDSGNLLRAGLAANAVKMRKTAAEAIAAGRIPSAVEGTEVQPDNGDTRPGTRYSSIEEIAVTVDANGRYPLGAVKKYGPDRAIWSYSAPNPDAVAQMRARFSGPIATGPTSQG